MCVLCVASALAQQLFPYPVPPESLPLGRVRANYMVEHFWDRVPWKSAYTAPAKMQQALNDFCDFLPLAAPDTMRLSVGKLIKESQRKPSDFATLMRLAQTTFNSDSAVLFSDEVYLPFAEAAAKYKKFSAREREQYRIQAQRICSSSEGSTLPQLTATDRDGKQVALNDTTSGASTYVFILETPGASAARFDRVRFAANVSARWLIEAGLVKPVLICAGEADADWWKSTASLPGEWTVVQMPQAADYFDLRVQPAIYMADSAMVIVGKWMPMNTLITNCEQLIRLIQKQQE